MRQWKIANAARWTLPIALVSVCVIQGLLLVVLDRYRSQFPENSRPHTVEIRPFNSTLSKQAIISRRDSETDNRQQDSDDSSIQIVFSTDCSGYQHWQGILLYYSALRIHQPGTITRIASGCTEEQQTTIQAEWNRIDPTQQKFKIHFAPTTALHGNYKYSNKPGGILHWLQHTLTLDNDMVVCLLDPDMVLLRPITATLIFPQWTARKTFDNKVIEYVDANGVAQRMRLANLPSMDGFHTRITTGFPAGQHFGIGGAWVQGLSPHARDAWKNFSKAHVCGSNNAPCTTTTMDDASHKYAVGPVYLASVQDWKDIAAAWSDFVPRVHEQYPYLLAEMYALTMAVANLELKFALFSSYMVTGSDVDSPTEAWSWIDRIIAKGDAHHICRGVSAFQPPEWTLNSTLALPTTLHYCQRYNLARHDQSFLFAKRKIPYDVFSCSDSGNKDLVPVPFNVDDLIYQIANDGVTTSIHDRRTIFALCHLAPMINWARQQYQTQVCRQ